MEIALWVVGIATGVLVFTALLIMLLLVVFVKGNPWL